MHTCTQHRCLDRSKKEQINQATEIWLQHYVFQFLRPWRGRQLTTYGHVVVSCFNHSIGHDEYTLNRKIKHNTWREETRFTFQMERA